MSLLMLFCITVMRAGRNVFNYHKNNVYKNNLGLLFFWKGKIFPLGAKTLPRKVSALYIYICLGLNITATGFNFGPCTNFWAVSLKIHTPLHYYHYSVQRSMRESCLCLKDFDTPVPLTPCQFWIVLFRMSMQFVQHWWHFHSCFSIF